MTRPIRRIDPRGQRFGAGTSVALLLLAFALRSPLLVAAVGVTLAVSAALGTRYFLLSRPWPVVRGVLGLGPPRDPEPELGPRFSQALGATALLLGAASLAAGADPLGWVLVGIVAALQFVLASTGFCLGCRLYGLNWWLPAQFDRLIGVSRPDRIRLQRPPGA
jgi:hypothetical protein